MKRGLNCKRQEGEKERKRERESFFSLWFSFFSILPLSLFPLLQIFCLCSLLFISTVYGQNNLQNQTISSVDITFALADNDTTAAEPFRAIVQGLVGKEYSIVRTRETLQALYDTDRIISARVEATEAGPNSVNLRFIIRRKTRAERVSIEVGESTGDSVTEEQLLLRLNLLNPGTAVTEQTLRNNADLIQSYLRDRGFYNAEVTYRITPLDSPTRVAVNFQVNPNTQSRVENFSINIPNFDVNQLRKNLKLEPGEFFSQRTLGEDVQRIREALIKQNFLAPTLSEPKVVFDPDKNTVDIQLAGATGPEVNVEVNAGDVEVGEGTQRKVLPIRREGTLEQSAIIEGERRLRNYFQEKGYFFANVDAVCSVQPPFSQEETGGVTNGTLELCANLSGTDLTGKDVTVTYNATLNRKLRLVDVRVEGTDKLTYEDVRSVLDTQEASPFLRLIPGLGYGRGYTSSEILEEDRDRLQTIMQELGYRNAQVSVRQGVSPTGDDLIITFVVDEGIPTKIEDVAITGNSEISTTTLAAALPDLEGKNFSRARARNGVQKLSEIYANQGYYDAKVSYSIVELPDEPNPEADKVKIIYNVDNEGQKVYINRILVNGNDMTDRSAIIRAITLSRNDVLRSADIFTSEQNLYATDAFRRVEIKPEPAGDRPGGGRLVDVIVNVEEQKPRVMTYGGGYSTDEGAFGLFDIRHSNLFGKLQQGYALVRMSRLQQLVQVSYLNPRFVKEGKNRFSPLSITAQYMRDSTVTRFFRTTLDQGAMGIVQRFDADGNPVDVFGNETAVPTLNRLTLSAETSRTLHKETRSILFLRYRFEDVRLQNIESLLVADLLRPDLRVRISGFVASFIRDTRQNCNNRQSLLDFIRTGEVGNPCRYNASDPTRGSLITLDYNVSLPALGANVGFNKFQANLQSYYTFGRLKKTTLAGRVIVGLGSVFKRNQQFADPQFQALNSLLPISERFFAGGSTTLRGFDFEGAGPRVVIVPQGIFRDSKGEIVNLTPFTVPVGGNALFVANLEARIPLLDSVQAVPFYDGGNVFRSVGDIFKKPSEVAAGTVFERNLQSRWTNTVGLGLRIKTPVGGSFAIDYGYLLNPPQFLIPQPNGDNAVYRLKQGQLHFRFAQIF